MSLTAPPSNLDDLHLRNKAEVMMKSGHTSSPDSTNSDSADKKDADKWIWVLDPMTRKLRVPLNLLAPTQATATPGTVPSLCIAYLEGRCRHPWCRQAHVFPSAIPQLRYEALNAPTCCHTHNDPHDITPLTSRFRHLRVINNGPNGSSELIPTDRVASTVGLLRFLVHNAPKKDENGADNHSQTCTTRAAESGTVTCSKSEAQKTGSPPDSVLDVPAKYICRLHLSHRCRYLEDCNNIHICRECELQLQPPPHMLSTLAAVTASARTVTVSDVCYSVTPLALNEVTDDEFQSITDTQKRAHALAACDGGADSTPVLFPDTSPVSNAKLPALPDPWGQGIHTPAFTSVNSASAPSSTFRVYDVRGVSTSKVATPAFSGRRGDSTPNSFGVVYGVDGGLPPPPPPHYANSRSHRDPYGQ